MPRHVPEPGPGLGHADTFESKAESALEAVLGKIRAKLIDEQVHEGSGQEGAESSTDSVVDSAPADALELAKEELLANFVVRPQLGGPEAVKKPRLEFRPHFEQDPFEFMMPEGLNARPSTMALLSFYGLPGGEMPHLRLEGAPEGWFSLGQPEVSEVSPRTHTHRLSRRPTTPWSACRCCSTRT